MESGDGGLSPQALDWLSQRVAEEAANPSQARVNPATIVEDRAATLADWHQTSLRAIERHGVAVDDQTINGIDCLRVTCPSVGTTGGKLMYIFGGGFMFGDPFSELPIVAALARYAALEVILPTYRLAPEHAAPAAADDCFAVWSELRSNTPRLALGGESAGGNLALVTAIRGRDEGLSPPAALALLSPAADLRAGDDQVAEAPTDPTLHPQTMLDVAQYYVADSDPEHPLISPVFDSMSGLPPTLITTGTRDMLLPGCLRLARKMRRAGVDVDCRVWPGLWHVFEFYDAYPEADESLTEIADFLAVHPDTQDNR